MRAIFGKFSRVQVPLDGSLAFVVLTKTKVEEGHQDKVRLTNAHVTKCFPCKEPQPFVPTAQRVITQSLTAKTVHRVVCHRRNVQFQSLCDRLRIPHILRRLCGQNNPNSPVSTFNNGKKKPPIRFLRPTQKTVLTQYHIPIHLVDNIVDKVSNFWDLHAG